MDRPNHRPVEDRVFRGSIVQIKDNSDPLRSDATLFAAALLTMGFRPGGPKLFHVTYEYDRGEMRYDCIWTFKALSRDGKYDGVKMRNVWDDHDWLVMNPKHSLTIIRAGLTYAKALSHTPRYTIAEMNTLDNPDALLECAMFNLIFILRAIPRSSPKGVVRLGPDGYAGYVPRLWSEPKKKEFLHYVERPDLRPKLTVPI
jgi:hypothetical protein